MAKSLAKLLKCLGGLEGKQARWIWGAEQVRRRWVERRKRNALAGGVAYITNGGDAQLPRRLATLAGKQAACSHACTRRCTRGGRAGQGRRDPYRITVGVHILPFSVLLQNSSKSWSGAKFSPKWKLCNILQATNHILVSKADSKWKRTNLAKQLEFQISN